MSDLNPSPASLTPATGGPATGDGRCGGRDHHHRRGGFIRGLFAGALLFGVAAGAAYVGSSHAHGGGAVWRLTSAELPREITITDAQGQRIGSARIEYPHQNNGPPVRVEQDDGKVFYARWSMPMQRVPFGFLGWLALIVLAAGRSARRVTAAVPIS